MIFENPCIKSSLNCTPDIIKKFISKSFAETNSRVVHSCEQFSMQNSTAHKVGNVNSRIKISYGQAKESERLILIAGVRGEASRLQAPLVPRPLKFCDRPHDREPGSDYKQLISGFKISIFTHRDSSTNRPTATCSQQKERRENPEKIL